MGKATSILYFILFLAATSHGIELNENIVTGTCPEITAEFKDHNGCIKAQNDNQCFLKLSCLAPELSKAAGRTFSALGPNCFATALYGSKLQSAFRGVSAIELQEVLNSSCTNVQEPQLGDIGIYYVEGFLPIHAYTFISENIVFEKPGVDYAGKTPVRFNTRSAVDFIHVASPECRRWGDETCHSKQTFYRCSKINYDQTFKGTLQKLNSIFDHILSLEETSQKDLKEIKPFYRKLYLTLRELAKTPLERATVHSIKLQIEFLEK
ncbi:MAG: hypothetical protein ACRBBP_10185 [Bdellovibrionales bacterium]